MTRSLFLTKLMLKCKPNYKGIPELQPQKNYSSLPQLCTPSQKEEKINHEIQETGIQYMKAGRIALCKMLGKHFSQGNDIKGEYGCIME